MTNLVDKRRIRFFIDQAKAEAYRDAEFERCSKDHPYFSISLVTGANGLRDGLQEFNAYATNLLIIVARNFYMVSGWSVTGDDITIEFDDDFPKSGPWYEQAKGRLRNLT